MISALHLILAETALYIISIAPTQQPYSCNQPTHSIWATPLPKFLIYGILVLQKRLPHFFCFFYSKRERGKRDAKMITKRER
jgi:hypothetical protein